MNSKQIMDNYLSYMDLVQKVLKLDASAAEYMLGDARATEGFRYTGDLGHCFTWWRTPQGHEYWKALRDKLRHNEQYELLRDLPDRIYVGPGEHGTLRAHKTFSPLVVTNTPFTTYKKESL